MPNHNNMFYKDNYIETVHLELSSKCNSMCPMCPRNVRLGKLNPYLPLTELSIKDIKKILPKEFIKQLGNLYACGNYGEPATAKDALLAYQYFRKNNRDLWLGMNTNGAVRTPEWWAQLAKAIEPKGRVVFAIDGLKDTNHLYRRGTVWENIMRNTQAFIQAGGNALWSFIVFKHNEHQVEEARNLSQKMGFKEFRLNKTGRFISGTTRTDTLPVKGINGEVEYFLERPTREIYQNKSLTALDDLAKKYGSIQNYFNEAKIICRAQEEKKVYISAEGLVFPCCWVAQVYPWHVPAKSGPIWEFIDKAGGLDKINAKKRPLRKIIKDKLFKLFEESLKKNTCEEGKLMVCARTCGLEFNTCRDQFN